jgi:NADP-dependent 3-hydroxy acid dehydrogenase YdfG
MKPIVLITGATSGIGRATAHQLAPNFRLILCGRRQDRLISLAEELSAQTEVRTLSFDVSDKGQVQQAFAKLDSSWQPVDVLINNAGNAHGRAPIHEGSVEDWDTMMDTNVKGLLYVSKAVMPGMVQRKQGHIINIGSIAGREVYAAGSVYCASKYAVHAINEGMRIDLLAHNIKVSSINPGLVNTEFSNVRFKGDQEKADAVYAGMKPLNAQDVAELIEFVVTRPAHVNIADTVIFPSQQSGVATVHRNP